MWKELTPEIARLEVLNIASAQHARTNAVPVEHLVAYAKVLEAYVLAKGSAEKSVVEDPLS